MKGGIESRLAKLEAAAGKPSSPFDGWTLDEMSVWQLDQSRGLHDADD